MQLPAELYRSYHQRRKGDLQRLREAFAAGDVEPFKMLGHQLKGNAPTYGYPELAKLGEEMEKLSSETLQTDGEKLLQDIQAWIEETEARLP